MPNYSDMNLPKGTRAQRDICNCYMCLTERSHGKSKSEIGRGHTKILSNKIYDSNGLNGNTVINNISKKKRNDAPSSSVKICSTCYQEIGKGKQHDCGTPSKACNNIIKLLENLPQK